MKILLVIFILGFNFCLNAQKEEEEFTFVEKMPTFIGGTEEMYKFLISNITFPDSCKSKGSNLMVITQFVVDSSGYIKNSKVVRGSDCGCNQEALRVLDLMNKEKPHWTPGENKGKKVAVAFTLPFKFINDTCKKD